MAFESTFENTNLRMVFSKILLHLKGYGSK